MMLYFVLLRFHIGNDFHKFRVKDFSDCLLYILSNIGLYIIYNIHRFL